MDPCAGEGTAITTLRELWTPSTVDDPEIPWHKRPARPTIEACELEGDRASQLRKRLDGRDRVHIGDAFRLVPQTDPSSGLTVLYLNPPYDHDPEYRRLEHRFLTRFTSCLYPGAGILFFLVPHHALSASAEFLASHYLEIRAWRLPKKHFDVFGQVLLVARRAARAMTAASMASTIEGWARKPESLPVLPPACPDPYTLRDDVEYRAGFHMAERDFGAALESFRPWQGTPTGVHLSARELMGARFLTAVPPKPAHIALALSTGIFNGRTLTPNDPKHPRVIAKGTFRRELVQIGERTNSEGELTGTVNVETPTLELTILRLDTYRFHHLSAGTVPTGSDNPADWNSADLITNYDKSLARELDRQFPAIHDPLDEAGQIRLPELVRVPYGAQSNAIQAALKLLARGLNPFIVAEVGTGKSTIGLFIAASLSPRYRAATLAELARVGGVQAKLPTVRRTLIVMPPHLLQSWTDQVAAVVPSWKVQVIRSEADLRAEADVYLLSRETAKLGHGFRGVDCCPRCGTPSEKEAKTNASRRLRCKGKRAWASPQPRRPPRRGPGDGPGADAARPSSRSGGAARCPDEDLDQRGGFQAEAATAGTLPQRRGAAGRCRRAPVPAGGLGRGAALQLRARNLAQRSRALATVLGTASHDGPAARRAQELPRRPSPPSKSRQRPVSADRRRRYRQRLHSSRKAPQWRPLGGFQALRRAPLPGRPEAPPLSHGPSHPAALQGPL